MAGHSKWANIQHRKGRQDAKRGKVFTRLIKEITVASRMGGAESGANPRLRLAMDKAFENNMPKDTVERAIKRGAGELEGVNYEEIRYEGYGIGGAAVMGHFQIKQVVSHFVGMDRWLSSESDGNGDMGFFPFR